MFILTITTWDRLSRFGKSVSTVTWERCYDLSTVIRVGLKKKNSNTPIPVSFIYRLGSKLGYVRLRSLDPELTERNVHTSSKKGPDHLKVALVVWLTT